MNPRRKIDTGVRQLTVSPEHGGQRIDNFLTRELKGVPRAAIYRMIRTGQVRVNGGRCKPDRKLSAGDEVRVPPARSTEAGGTRVSAAVLQQVNSAIRFENADVLVIDKPAGMAVHAGTHLPWGLIDALRQSRPGEFVELVHRLDRETSGCMILARNGAALRHLSAQFRDNRVDKRYLCLLDGRLAEARVDVDAPVGRDDWGEGQAAEPSAEGKQALTRFRVLERIAGVTYAEAEPFTGRTHQIRLHALHLGMPLAGDPRYASRAAGRKWRKLGLDRLFLHAHRLSLALPDGAPATFDSPLPDALREVLVRLEDAARGSGDGQIALT